MKRQKHMLKIFVFVVLFVIISIGAVLFAYPEDREKTVTIYMNQEIGVLKLKYGANEHDSWEKFVTDPRYSELHKEAGTELLRIWLTDADWITSTIPYSDQGYDFTNIDKLVNATLLAGATPYVVFAHAPAEFSEQGIGWNDHAPTDLQKWGSYVWMVAQHLKDSCDLNKFSKPCDASDWYYEIWNEPWLDHWWQGVPSKYTQVYNHGYWAVKDVLPNAKVGGYCLAYFKGFHNEWLTGFLKYAKADFISIHHYGNSLSDFSTEHNKMRDTEELFYTSVKELKTVINQFSPMTEIINSEYSSDFRSSYMDHLDEPFTVAWYASALMWQAKSGVVDAEIFYSGTTNSPDRGFGMWSPDSNGTIVLWDVFYMKKAFTELYSKGSILKSKSSDKDIEVLATRDEEVHISIVNKKDSPKSITLILDRNPALSYEDYETKDKGYILNNRIHMDLEPYEVKFLVLKN